MSSRCLELQGVGFAYFPGSPVLRRVSLRLGPGLTLLVGANGTGKSTLLKVLAGVEHPDVGQVLHHGHDLWEEEVKARRDLAYLPEQPEITPYASVRELLRLVASLRGEAAVVVEEVLAEAGLAGLGERSVRQLSKGQRRRALLAAAWIGRPRTLLLDEPLDAMDLGMRERILGWITEVRRAEGLIVAVSHELEPFLPLADRLLAATEGSLRLVEELPSGAEERQRLCEDLARGTGSSRRFQQDQGSSE